MKKSLWLAIIFILVALFSMPFAFGIIDSQRKSVVITEEVISGDPKAAEGVNVEFLTHWDALALWSTRYTIGTGETVTEFTFEGDGVTWPRQESEYFEFNIPVNFGTAVAVEAGVRIEDNVGVQLDDMWIPKVLKAVAERTKAGNSYTETVALADYYKYYPLELSVRSEAHDMSFYSNGVDYFSDFFHVEVPTDEKISVTITKNPAGVVTAVECSTYVDESNDWQRDGLSIDTAYDFGEKACLFTYACTDWDTGERVAAEENTGIFYAPYVENNRRFTIPGHVKKVCDIPKDIVPTEMLWDEAREELYMTAMAEDEYRLYIYKVAGENVTLKQELSVLSYDRMSGKKLPSYREMTLEEGGILIKWAEGNFSFVAESASGYELWCSDVFVADVQYLEDLMVAGNRPIDVGWEDELVGYEHALMFDGERLVLAAYDSWDSVNVTLAVYNQTGQLYCGQYRHSAESDLYLEGMDFERIYAQGSKSGSNRRQGAGYQPLKIWVE